MEILLIIIHIIALIVLVICLIALGWHLHILKEQKQEKGGYITLDGDVTTTQHYYFVRILESDDVIEHLRIPRDNHTLNTSGYQIPVEINIKKSSL